MRFRYSERVPRSWDERWRCVSGHSWWSWEYMVAPSLPGLPGHRHHHNP